MSFVDKILNVIFFTLIIGGSILLGLVTHAILGLENWLMWGALYALVPLALLWVVASLAKDESTPYCDDLVGYTLPPRPKKKLKFRMIVECFETALIILFWPLCMIAIVLFAVWVILSYELSRLKQTPAAT